MAYTVVRNDEYDFKGLKYAATYPNLHPYPATMLPNIGIKALQDFNATSGSLLDPYCGSGSSLVAGLDVGLERLVGYDLNPLACLITNGRLTPHRPDMLYVMRNRLRNVCEERVASRLMPEHPTITNKSYWFSEEASEALCFIKGCIDACGFDNTLISLAFSETVRKVSYIRQNEFKLYRISKDALPVVTVKDVFNTFFPVLDRILSTHREWYLYVRPINFSVICEEFKPASEQFDVVLTSPPYGDSRTTVAYGQFSTLSNEWLGIADARKLDGRLMGGKKSKALMQNSLITDYLNIVSSQCSKRALEVSSFYEDLAASIKDVASVIKKGGKSIYLVGNRTVKGVQLPTDQFIAEQFELNGLKHVVTYKRLLSSKSMPSKNSPTNVAGKSANTMSHEYLVVCQN